MGDDKGSRNPGMNIDGTLVRELAELLAETNLSEIEVEDGDRRIRVARAAAAPAQAPAFFAAPAAAPQPVAAAPVAEAAAPAVDGNAVKSPMVGTAYLSSEPGAAPFVSVGQSV